MLALFLESSAGDRTSRRTLVLDSSLPCPTNIAIQMGDIRLLGKMQVIAKPFSRIDLIGVQARLPICQWQEEPPSTNDERQHYATRGPQS